MEKNKVVLFPKWKKDLERESLKAIKEKNYRIALPMIEELLEFEVNNHEILMGKLICLMELGQSEEAILFCESILNEDDPYYYDYLFFYVNILFQANELEAVVDQLNYEKTKNHMPSEYHEQLHTLFELSNTMLASKKEEAIYTTEKELQEIIQTKNYSKQWMLVEKLRQAKRKPAKYIYDVLLEPTFHPVVKTAILLWCKEQEVNREISLVKFHAVKTIDSKLLLNIEEYPFYQAVMKEIQKLDDSNPTYYQLLLRQFYRFAYVRYPFYPDLSLAKDYAKAMTESIKLFLSDEEMLEEEDETLYKYREEIYHAEAIYLSIIED